MDGEFGVIAEWELSNLRGNSRRYDHSSCELFLIEFAHEAVISVPWLGLRWWRRRPTCMAVTSIAFGCIVPRPFVRLFFTQTR
jgi:hypothetical protein